MKIIENIVKWLCRKFTRDQVLKIVEILNIFLNDPEVIFKEPKTEHPNYRKFQVDPEVPLQDSEQKVSLDYREILKTKKVEPIKHRGKNRSVKFLRCPHCNAPSRYIYINNGNKENIQYRCKICKKTFCKTPKKNATKYFCPICKKALYKWKSRLLVTLYKCGNDKCQRYLENINKLTPEERIIQKEKPSQFKLRYIFRDYKIDLKNINKEEMKKPMENLDKFSYSLPTIGLVLTFYITLALSTRKTAFALNNIFRLRISHNTVARIARASSTICHHYNLEHIPKVEGKQAADETYIKVKGKHHYVWLSIAENRSIITAYRVSDARDEINAVKTLAMASEKFTPNHEDEPLTMIVDGNPSYQAATVFLEKEGVQIDLKKVIGLKNNDDISATYRYLKNLIERVNRTYKHYSPGCFQNIDGASSHLALAITNYNFLRPHSSLNYKTPVINQELMEIPLIQDRWAKILLSMN